MSELNEAQRAVRGEHAKRALEEFLDPAFDRVVEDYTARLEEIAARTPWEAGKITALANAVRIVKEVHAQIYGLVAEGQHAKSGMIRAERIEKLTPAKRRLLSIGGY